MKTKIIKISNLPCILCINKLNTVLSSIPDLYYYKVNVFTKEILVKYKRQLPIILKEINDNGFETEALDFNPYFINGILIILFKISSNIIYLQLLLMSILQYRINKIRSLKFYRFFSLLSFCIFFLRFNKKHLDNSCNILLYVFLNTLITERLNLLGRLNMFSILEKTKFKKIVSDFTLTDEKLYFKNKNNKKEFDKSIVYYEIVDLVKPMDIILYKKNDLVNVSGKIIKGKCLVDDSSNTGEDLLKLKLTNDIITEEMILKEGSVLVEVLKINTYDTKHKNISRSIYNEILIVVNILIIIYSFFYCDCLPDMIEYIVKMNMKICPCIFLISDIFLKLRIKKEIKHRDIRINNFNISKNIQNIFIDKTGTLTKTSKVLKYKIDKDIEWIIYKLENEFYNNYSRGILKVLKNINFKDKEYISSFGIRCQFNNEEIKNKEYISSFGIRCQFNNEEIRIGKYSFCNYLNLNYQKYNRNTIYVSRNSKICGYFLIQDFIKKDTKNVISILQSKYKVILLSGDTKRNVEEFCDRVNIKEYFYNLSSKEKSEIIYNYKGVSCMIGDGINDIQAFLSSNISIGLKDKLNTDINIKDIKDIVHVLEIIKKTNNRKIINYCISAIYNLVIIFCNIGFIESTFVMYIPNLLILINTICL